VTDEYEHRLQARVSNARVQPLPCESVMRQRLGQLFISLGNHLQGLHPFTIISPDDLEWATNRSPFCSPHGVDAARAMTRQVTTVRA